MQNLSMDMTMLAVGIGFATIIIFLIIFFGSYNAKKVRDQSLKLQTNEQYFQSLYQQNPDLVLTFNLEGDILSANKVIEFYGYTEDELRHQSFVPYVVPEQLESTIEHFQLAKKGVATNYDSTIYSKNGECFNLNITNIPIIVDEQIVGVYGILKDTTELNRAQESLKEAESKYRSLAEESLVGIYIIQDGRFVYANRKMTEMLGYREEQIIGSNVIDYIYPEDHIIVDNNIRKRLQEGFTSVHYQYRAMKKDKTIIHMEVLGSKSLYKGKPALRGTVIDITARKNAEETIEFMAYHDGLTGLANRYHFCNRLEASISDATINNLAILLIDLDQFKLINDAMGHEIGARLLKAVTERLKDCVETSGDIARNDGNEFMVSLQEMHGEEVSVVAERILECFTKPFDVGQYELYITPSIGISLYPTDGRDIEDLIKKADSAMYQVKRKGKNNYQFYNHNQLEHTYERLELETDLRKAMERKEFQLYYQPKLDLASGKITGVEALIRWKHPEKGFISPGEFIPLAEKMGLIIQIGEWVLRTACEQTKTWQEAGLSPLKTSVNLSVLQLYQPNLIEEIRLVLEETGLDPTYLELEITESMMIDSDHALKVLRELKKIGVTISLDDFGTGYSSLHYLKEVPINKLKIDQSFVRNCTVDANDATIIKTIIAMAHQLNLEVVAEGVESKDQLVFLQRNLCDEVQGYLFSKPVPQKEFVEKFEELEQIINLNGIPQELTNQKWMEEALRIARQELLDTVRQQQGMIFKFSEDGGRFIHTLCDGELMYRMGLIPEKIIGKELHDFLPLEIAGEKDKFYRRAWEGVDNVTYEGFENGLYYLASLRPVRKGGQVVEVIGSCVDITERKRVEEALKLSEANYRLITENMLDLVGVWDVNGRVIYASPSHETVLGSSPNVYIGKMIFDLVHPDDTPRIQEQFFHMVSTKTPSQVEFRCKHSSGEWIHVEVQLTPVSSKAEEVDHIVAVGRDISERKRMDEMIRKTEKLSVVGQLAAGVAHEIRNPLTSIKGFLQLMQEELDTPNFTDIMLLEIDHIEDILKEFLSLAKPNVNKISPNDINVVLQYAVTLINAQTVLKNIEIIQVTESDLPPIDCDDHQIKQIFINILQNAIEAMPSGGVIEIRTMWYGSEKIKVRFIDQGCGISEERMKNIGEPFYSTKEKGTGLGLMISHKMIEEHGGTITIESEVNRGTTVDIVLPIKQSYTE